LDRRRQPVSYPGHPEQDSRQAPSAHVKSRKPNAELSTDATSPCHMQEARGKTRGHQAPWTHDISRIPETRLRTSAISPCHIQEARNKDTANQHQNIIADNRRRLVSCLGNPKESFKSNKRHRCQLWRRQATKRAHVVRHSACLQVVPGAKATWTGMARHWRR